MPEPLRIGILCDGPLFQRWQGDSIRKVLAVPGVELVVVVVNDKPARSEPGAMRKLLRYPWRLALYLRYRQRNKPKAYAPVDLSTDLAGVPRVLCRTTRSGSGEQFGAEDLTSIRLHRPDVLLRFGFNILKGDILELPRYGVWSYHHGDEEKYRGQPPGFWEIMEDEAVVGAVLQRLTERLDAGYVLRKGWFGIIGHSLEETMDRVLTGSAGWAAQVCQELVMGRAKAAVGTLSTTKAPVRKYPSNGTFLRYLLKRNENLLRFRQRSTKQREEWNIGVLYQPIRSLLDDRPNLNVRWLPSPSPGQYRASPFGYMADQQLNVLYEKFDHATGRGEISRLRPKRDNVLKRSRTLLADDQHRSYPFVVEHEGTVYLVPEHTGTGRVELYRMDTRNSATEHVRTLLNEPLFSPTLFQHEGRWWLFGTQAPLENEALYAYCAEQFEGPYTAHPQNPVKMDVRSARPGGTPFMSDGVLYRPAQDRRGARRIALMRVLELSPIAYREEWVKTIGPLKGSAWSLGLGTVSAVGDITLVDGLRSVQSKKTGSGSRRNAPAKTKAAIKPSRAEEHEEEEEDED